MKVPEIVPLLYQFLQKAKHGTHDSNDIITLCNMSSGPIIFFVWESDSPWRILSASPNFLEKLGYSPFEVVGKNLTDFIHSQDLEVFRKNNTGSQDFYRSLETSYRFFHKEKGYQRIFCYLQPANHAGYIIDANEARRILGRLLQDRQQIQAIIDNVPLFGYSIQNERINFWQGQGLADIGLGIDTVDEQLLENVTTLLPMLDDAITEAKATGRSSSILSLGEYYFQNHTIYLDADNIHGVCLDVSADQQAKRESEQFAYSASHDLQQPLRAVANYNAIISKLLLEKTVGLLQSGKMDEALHTILDEVKLFLDKQKATAVRMNAIIEGLLELSRTDDTPIASHPMAEIIAEVIDDLSGQIEAIEGRVNIEVVNFMPTVRCNRTQIYQVFQNLISNALKYRHPDRPCRISLGASPVLPQSTDTKNKSSYFFKEKPHWKFWVIDNGVGVPEGWEERIFQPFKSAPNGNAGGIGMGLAIVQRLVTHHKGRIWFNRPNNNEGSEFFFTLPQ